MPKRKDLANAIRVLSMDAVQKANSGHPGMPMGMADIAEVLWNDFLKHNPHNPKWPDRDRFVLSNGHGSMLQYALLHLTGYDLSIDDLKQFRQLHSKTPGHPEYGYTPGVETTTGPLGQGLANAVGMAIAERSLCAHFNQPNFAIVNHYTYAFVGDGCLMEGISHEVCSLAGTLGLGKLIVFYDDNRISIDGDVAGWFTDDTPSRFHAYGWQVIPDVDGHDSQAIHDAIVLAQQESSRPTLICCKTVIGYGAPNAAGSEGCHGAPLGDKEIAATRVQLGWPYPPFEIPAEIYEAYDACAKGEAAENEWHTLFLNYKKQYPELAEEFIRRISGELPSAWKKAATTFIHHAQAAVETVATRKASQQFLDALAPQIPEFMGGSADLTGSNLTNWQGCQVFSHDNPAGNYLHYGVREFGMAAIMNGLAVHGGFIPFGGTFLTFVDYSRNAVRMAALMKQRVIHVFTHDSIGLGEDGPTHQSIEHASMLRLTPNLAVWRPCDATETATAWKSALEQTSRPTCLLLSRQNCIGQTRDAKTLAAIERGGYILQDCQGQPDIILIATGSEVSLAMQAATQLADGTKKIRVVSMPSTTLFDEQDKAYRESVLPSSVTARVAIEAGISDFWYKYVGLNGKVIGLTRYGESAPAKAVYEALGITVEAIVNAVSELSKGVYLYDNQSCH